ncbi:hypothetical protein M419DRAFT_125293 [Trichoderma reesei RUT C-30]|uniref:Uncharacterized protein n=1 Tax=Hypocrea jecorina (strain ATCC 56765 / BCRC 32924 / NRRL 11460 / Rut C-30) TaxID=1344414 RepID=A0A024RVZ5_HYPJR|nr:hypothetical protein M419DRAFT_125293 [Trichoderma reesei RUT C-30]
MPRYRPTSDATQSSLPHDDYPLVPPFVTNCSDLASQLGPKTLFHPKNRSKFY